MGEYHTGHVTGQDDNQLHVPDGFHGKPVLDIPPGCPEQIPPLSKRIGDRGKQQLALEQGDIGIVQQRIERTDRVTSLQLDILNNDIAALETVDAYETSARMNELINQIEVSYAVTGRLRQLSLVRFI